MVNQSTSQNFQSDDDDRLPEGTDGSKSDGEVLDLDDLLEQSEKIQAEHDAKDDK